VRFVDTNVILRYLVRDDEEKAQACLAVFQRAQTGSEELFTCESVIAEAVYVLSSHRGPYRLGHDEIAARLMPIVGLRGLRMPQKRVCERALEVYRASLSLDFEDALAIAHMERQGIAEVLSYDRDFDGIAGVKRVEP
jgi:predicted nucleic acid-binding protein